MTCRYVPSRRRAGASAPVVSLWVLCLGVIASAVIAQPPNLISINPGVASPGDPIAIAGGVFDGAAEDYLAWVRTSNAGFVLEDLAVPNTSSITATVGPVATVDTGSVELWQGRGHAMPDRTLRVDDRLLSIYEGRVFAARHAASGSVPLAALTASMSTIESSLLGSGLGIDLGVLDPTLLFDGGSIRVDIVIETGGSKKGSGTSGGGGNVWPTTTRPLKVAPASGPRWALHFVVEPDTPFVDTAEGTAAEALASALAVVLDEQFGALGLSASATGSQVDIESVGGILGGFATLVAD